MINIYKKTIQNGELDGCVEIAASAFPQWWHVPEVEYYHEHVTDPWLQAHRRAAEEAGHAYFRAALIWLGGRGRAAEDQEYAEVLWDGDGGVGWVAMPDADETIVADSLDDVLREAFPEISLA
jgi:hypothetical protein